MSQLPRDRLSGGTADALPAIALAARWQAEVWAPGAVPGVRASPDHRAALSLAGLVMLLPLAARRRAPLASCAMVLAGTVLAEAVGPSPEGLSEVAGVLVASYSVACYSAPREACTGLALIVTSQLL